MSIRGDIIFDKPGAIAGRLAEQLDGWMHLCIRAGYDRECPLPGDKLQNRQLLLGTDSLGTPYPKQGRAIRSSLGALSRPARVSTTRPRSASRLDRGSFDI